MVLRGLGVVQEAFWAESDPEMPFGCIDHNFSALFQARVSNGDKPCLTFIGCHQIKLAPL
jgi:hypothetical protein